MKRRSSINLENAIIRTKKPRASQTIPLDSMLPADLGYTGKRISITREEKGKNDAETTMVSKGRSTHPMAP